MTTHIHETYDISKEKSISFTKSLFIERNFVFAVAKIFPNFFLSDCQNTWAAGGLICQLQVDN